MDRNSKQKDKWFKMGAAVAVGELWSEGRLGTQEEDLLHTRSFLGSFGIKEKSDLAEIGLGDAYLEDFDALLVS